MNDVIFIPLRDAIKILGISKGTAIRLIKKGKLRGVRDSLQRGKFLVSEASIEEFMKNRFKKLEV